MKKLALFLLLCFTFAAAGAGIVLNTFNSGELTPVFEGRVDVLEYYMGSRTLENMVVLTQGAVTKRSGTYYIEDANVITDVRVIPFEYRTEEPYVIELGNTYMRFYKEQ